MCWSNHDRIDAGSMANSTWVTLHDLGRRFGISSIHADALSSRKMARPAWPFDPAALSAGAVEQRTPHSHGSFLWNADVCAVALERRGYQPPPRSEHVGQWVDYWKRWTMALRPSPPPLIRWPRSCRRSWSRTSTVNSSNRGCRYQVHRPLSSRLGTLEASTLRHRVHQVPSTQAQGFGLLAHTLELLFELLFIGMAEVRMNQPGVGRMTTQALDHTIGGGIAHKQCQGSRAEATSPPAPPEICR